MKKNTSFSYTPLLMLLTFFTAAVYGQQVDSTQASSKQPLKLNHAEPLYIDLIRDLGARKGEREWNIGLGLTDKYDFDEYVALVEYEFAPIDRLGLEIELPFTFFYPVKNTFRRDSIPQSQLNSLKVAGQYTFLVSEKLRTSMAIGYIHEFELVPFKFYGKTNAFSGNVYNPFFVAAKNFGRNMHGLLYTGPAIIHHFNHSGLTTVWQINSNIHYMIPDTKNFLGIELNKTIQRGNFDMVIRPQMRLMVAENLMIGIVAGIPVSRKNERLSSFLRLIYEPKHH